MSSSQTQSDAARDALYARLQSFAGRPMGEPQGCPYPVNEPMIHHWCDAIGDRNPSYVDPTFAEGSIHGGIVAPPTMLQAWTMRGLRPRPEAEPSGPSALEVLDEAGFTSVVATNCEQEYFRYLKPGDALTHVVEIESVSPEKKTALGVGHFLTQLYTFRDAEGAIVGTMRFRLLKFRPPEKPAADAAPKRPRPRPSINQDNAFFWKGAEEGRLLIQRCTGCQRLRHPPGPACPRCHGLEWDTLESSGRGEIYSWVRHYYPNIQPFEPGHPVVLVELEEGVRIVSDLKDAAPEDVAIGRKVEVVFDRVDDQLVLPRFRIVPD